jgi:hypothetical protein
MKLTGRKRSGFEVFPAAHSAGLIKLGLMVSGDRGRAEDAAQEALVRVYQRWTRLDDPLAYARRIVVDATRDDWRRAERATRAHDDAGRLGRLDDVDDVEASFLERDALLTALAAGRPRSLVSLVAAPEHARVTPCSYIPISTREPGLAPPGGLPAAGARVRHPRCNGCRQRSWSMVIGSERNRRPVAW